jgi:hypothetical protein
MQQPYTLIHPGAREKCTFFRAAKTGFASVKIMPENDPLALT